MRLEQIGKMKICKFLGGKLFGTFPVRFAVFVFFLIKCMILYIFITYEYLGKLQRASLDLMVNGGVVSYRMLLQNVT